MVVLMKNYEEIEKGRIKNKSDRCRYIKSLIQLIVVILDVATTPENLSMLLRAPR